MTLGCGSYFLLLLLKNKLKTICYSTKMTNSFYDRTNYSVLTWKNKTIKTWLVNDVCYLLSAKFIDDCYCIAPSSLQLVRIACWIFTYPRALHKRSNFKLGRQKPTYLLYSDRILTPIILRIPCFGAIAYWKG